MEKVWGTCVFEIEEHVHVQKGKAVRERQRQKLQGKKSGVVIDNSKACKMMGCSSQCYEDSREYQFPVK